MEASQTPGAPENEGQEPREPVASTPQGAPEEPRNEGAEPSAVPSAADEQPSEDERNPAPEQSPAATAAQDAIIGDPGLRDEQEPQASVGSADIPVRTSPPPPNAQSGVPLPEDRAAGVEPGPKGPVVPGGVAEDETPEHDASEGQSTTPPLG